MSTLSTPSPKIIVSSRDQHPVPHLAGAVKLAETARAHGWTATATYALADVPDEYFGNGNLARPAHRLASVVVRLRRAADLGWAVWLAEDDATFRFAHAFVGFRPYGWSTRPGLKLTSILERVSQP